MKKLITLLLLAATVSLANAQQPDSTRNATNKAETENTIICTDEETPAQFPGGEEALYAFLFNNLIYPQKAKNFDHQGKVIVAFDVEKDGSLSNITIKKSVWPELDSEAVRVVSLMPKWQPATLISSGEPVRTHMALPIIFQLHGDEEIHNVVEKEAQFPGGDKALKSFLFNNLNYPKKAVKKGIQGTVLVEFVVEKDGTISNIRVKRSVSRELDAEAVRVVSIMPKWKPATLKGEIVRSLYRLPIHFALQL
ncbi:MAG: TonB family protein [Bacteroidales bacterium]|nr:TonB family protein [Bacteroidales bacterium]